MKKIKLFLLTLCLSCLAAGAQNNGKMDYGKEWKEIEKLHDTDRLPKSALEKLQSLYDTALKNKDYPEVIKAIYLRSQFIEEVEDDAAVLEALKADVPKLPQPAKSIVYSYLGDFFSMYLAQSAWRIYSRTSVSANPEDFKTWSVQQLADEAVRYYMLSMEDAKTLRKTPARKFSAVIGREDYDGTNYLLTLYDLLGYKAISDMNLRISVYAQPRDVFVINDLVYFAPAEEFVKLTLPATDTASIKYKSLQMYQHLLAFRLNEAEASSAEDSAEALTDLDMRRLSYVRSSGVYTNKDELYERALRSMLDEKPRPVCRARIAYELAYLYKDWGLAWRSSGKPEHRGKLIEAGNLCEEIQKLSLETIVAHYAKSLHKEILGPVLSLNVDQYQLPGKPILYKATYRNVDRIYFHIYSWEDERDEGGDIFGDYKKMIKNRKPVAVREAKTVSQPDYQSYSAEMALEGLAEGRYIILASNRPYLPAVDDSDDNSVLNRVELRVYGLTFLAHDANESEKMKVYVTDRDTGKPVEGAKVEAYTLEYSRIQKKQVEKLYSTSITGKDGMAEINMRKDDNNNHISKLKISHNGKRVEGAPNTYGPRDYNGNQSEKVLFFTDRAIYRPGQTVYFKGLVYETCDAGDYKPIVRKEKTVQLRDVNSKEVTSLTLTTNEFGSLQGSFILPQGLLNGQMRLQTGGGICYFMVEEYKRPTFDVTFDKVTETHKLNDAVQVKGTAKALAGYAVDGAEVQYRVIREVTRRYYYWWWPPIQDASREIASGTSVTDEKGVFTIDFTALADDVKDDNLIYTYVVTADVTDVNGETRSSRLDLKVSNKPLIVNAVIPEVIRAGEKLTFPVGATNLNDEPVPAKVTITVSELKSPGRILRKRLWSAPDTLAVPRDEFVRLFPFDPYGEEDMPSGYPVVKQVASVTTDTDESKEADLSALRNAKSGWYRIDIKGRDGKGVEVEQQAYVQLEGVTPDPIRRMDSWTGEVKRICEPGETAVLTVAGGTPESYVLYEKIIRNKVVEQKHLEVGTTPRRIEIPVGEENRGGFAVQLTMVQSNRLYTTNYLITVPYTNKMLDVSFTTFRDKLLPGEAEKWTITVRNKAGEKEAAEMVATLYDASLDAFARHAWATFGVFYPQQGSGVYWRGKTIESPVWSYNLLYRYGHARYYQPSYPDLMGYYYEPPMRARGISVYDAFVESLAEDVAASQEHSEAILETKQLAYASFTQGKSDVADVELMSAAKLIETDLTAIATRQNFNETAFFYPQLRTNEEGEILIDFTIPEALTRWKMMGFAHTKDFKVGTVTNELITQKEVAISANAPRFFRENDKIIFTAKVNNLTEAALTGKAMLRLYDAVTMQPIEGKLLKSSQTTGFTVPAEGSTGVSWTLHIPYDVQAITYKLTAQAGNHTDGEEKTVPVLMNSMLVTESVPFSVRGGQTKDFTFDKLRNHKSTTLRNRNLTLEYTSNPAWYAVLALPYLMEYPHECAEQVFSRIYANSLASAMVNSSPQIKQVFDRWNTEGSQALLSNLEKNQELKQVMLEETPWVMQADSEKERRQRIAILFDLNRMGNELRRAYDKLGKMQHASGGFPWFEGMEPDRFITQHIVAGLSRLLTLNLLSEHSDVANMISYGLTYLDGEMRADYDRIIKNKYKLEDRHIGYLQLHHLYAASFITYKPSGKKEAESFDYYLRQTEKYWTNMSVYEQAMATLVLRRYGKTDAAMKIIASLKERARHSQEMGMYWEDSRWGYFWYQAPIERQALLIEAFNEAAGDTESVEEMKIWLLRQKQTTDWRTTKATTEAVHALLMTGGNLLDNSETLEVKLGGKPLDKIAAEPIRPEAGTGYVKTSWKGGDIKQSMGEMTVTNPNAGGIAWGALYWQYFEQLDKITGAETNLKMNKQLFLKKVTDRGEVLEPLSENNTLRVGDLVKVRMELRADRDFEYVHLKDTRAAGFEPVSTVSGYRYQGGLGYYESVKDASVNFFISYLRKGTYVFEYELRVSHAGDFSNGITTFQCMYAPEFSSHSEGIRVKVE